VRVLIVEDEAKMARLIQAGLRRNGIVADIAGRGEEAVWMSEAIAYDAIVLDLRLPGIDGVETCGRIREQGIRTPILMLTVHDELDRRVGALDAGADDFLTKPFFFAELLARLRALARRGPLEHGPVLEVGDLRLEPATRRVWRGDTELELSAKEFNLLEAFMREPGAVLSRYRLLERAWDFDYDNRSNVVASYIRLLRLKIDRPFGLSSIETVRGAGYRLREDGGCRYARG
jgi:two-component system OmpR family response regulator